MLIELTPNDTQNLKIMLDIIPNQPALMALTNVALEVVERTLILQASDLNVSARAVITPWKLEEFPPIAVEGKPLLKLMLEMKEFELTQSKHKLTIKSNAADGFKADLPIANYEDYPLLPAPPDTPPATLPDFSSYKQLPIDTSGGRPNYSYAHWDGKTLQAADGFLALISKTLEQPIQAPFTEHIIKRLSDFTGIVEGEHETFFLSRENLSLSYKTPGFEWRNFIALEKLIPLDLQMIKLSKKELSKALRALKITVNKESMTVKAIIEPGEIILTTKSELGESTKKLIAPDSNMCLTFLFHLDYMLKMLSNLDETIFLGLRNDSRSPFVYKDEYTTIIQMPMHDSSQI